MQSIRWTETNGYELIETDEEGNETILGSGATVEEAIANGTK